MTSTKRFARRQVVLEVWTKDAQTTQQMMTHEHPLARYIKQDKKAGSSIAGDVCETSDGKMLLQTCTHIEPELFIDMSEETSQP